MTPTLFRFNAIALGLLTLTITATRPSHADNTADGERGRKEDTRFESQNDFDFDMFPFYGDGIAGAQYTGTYSSDGNSKHGATLRFESNMFSLCRYKDRTNHSNCLQNGTSAQPTKRALFFPVQFTARLDFDPTKNQSDADKAFLVTQFKQSIFRVLLEEGFTIEGLGYLNQFVQKAGDPYTGFRLQGFEIVNIKTVQAINTASPNFQITFDLSASFGLGWMDAKTTRRTFDFGSEKRQAGDVTGTTVTSYLNGSLGFRISQKLLAEAIGGVDIYKHNPSTHPKLLHPFVGGRINFRALDGEHNRALDLNLTVQKDYFIGDLTNEDDLPSEGITTNAGLTVHY